MLKVGIDTLALYTSRYAFDLSLLASTRGVDPDKYRTGLGQFMMAVPPPGEDIVTMAANAAKQALQNIDTKSIEMLLFATESGIDQSKAAGLFVHGLLDLPSRCRVVELKQACYGATAALQLALPYLRENPDKKVLVIAADIARYGLGTTGESSQGAGAIAMVLSANPRILAIEPEFGVAAENVMDFWRPNYAHEAFVDGKYSSKLYLLMLEKAFKDYQANSLRQFVDHEYFCYHSPVPRLVEKAHQHLLKLNGRTEDASKQIQTALEYGRRIGNSYAASLYIGLASLLDLSKEDLGNKRVGFYSYGSGCVAEFFSGVIQPQYRAALHTDYHTNLLATRVALDYEQYEKFFSFTYPEDGSAQTIPQHNTGLFRLTRFEQHKRIYEKVPQLTVVNEAPSVSSKPKERPAGKTSANVPENTIKVLAPGKLILSGEHAVVYGKPALAMAINRYVTATVTRESIPQILFDLSDLAHHSRLSFHALRHLKERVKRKYHRFIRGDFSIREVLQKPFELAQFALGVLAESHNLTLPHGVKIHLQSDIPIGCGMGSSAATILSVMQATSHYLQIPLSQDALFKLALEAENMQHGYSTGLDLRVALQGGCLYMQEEKIEPRTIPKMPFYLINTGSPLTTTGQCVEKVAPLFKSNALQNDFAAVTHAMDKALSEQSWQNMQSAIRENHRLLVEINVVPEKIRQFVRQIESQGGAAKICGAGAISGDQAGALLVATEDKRAVQALCNQFAYNLIPISGETRGVHAA